MIVWALALVVGIADPWHVRFPEDDVVVIEHETRVSILADGRSTTRHRRVSRPLTIVGREDYSDLRIGFVAPLQTVEAIRCSVRRGDGAEVQAQSHAFNAVTPDGYGMAPDFVQFRELVVSPPGVEEGVEIAVEYDVADSSAFPWYEAVIPIGDIHPVLRRAIHVENRGAGTLAWALYDAHSCSLGTGSSVALTFNDLPPYPVAGGPLSDTATPRLAVSTCPGWPELAGWWAARLPPDSLLPGEASDSLAVRLRTAVTREETLQAVVDVVATAVEPVPAPDRRFWAHRDPARVFASGYAEPLEAAWLMAALARGAGCDAAICLVGDPLPPGTPPVTGLLSEPWVMVRGPSPRWLNLQGWRRVPRPDAPFDFLILAEGCAPSAGPNPRPRRGEAVLTLAKEGADSLRVRGSLRLSASLVPDGADPAKPEGWIGPRMKRIVRDAAVSWVSDALGDEGVAYRFDGLMPLGDGVFIDHAMQAWFGAGWVPPGALASDVVPRVPVMVPSDVELSGELRVVLSEELDVVCTSDSAIVPAGVGSYRVEVEGTPGLLCVRRACSLQAGWLDQRALREVREIMAMEGRRGQSSVFIRPSSR